MKFKAQEILEFRFAQHSAIPVGRNGFDCGSVRFLGTVPVVEFIYRLATSSDWEAAQRTGFFQSQDLAAEGFIHFATSQQLPGVYSRYYRGQCGLVVLCVDPAKLPVAVTWENTRGGTELFPHVYAPVPLNAVKHATPATVDADGNLVFAEN